MMNLRKTTMVALLMLFGASACADLEVTNPNDPTRSQALASPGDVESLITSSFQQWWLGQYSYGSSYLFLSATSFQHSSAAANACMKDCAALPRGPLLNEQVDQFYGNMAGVWNQSYTALAAIADGLRSINNDPELQEAFDPARLTLVNTLARFVQGLAHASVAVLYEKGYVITEDVDIFDEGGDWIPLGEPLGYMALMDEAMNMFDQALTLANENIANTENTFRGEWLGMGSDNDLTYADLIPIIHSLKARYMSQVARTPAERDALDWGTIEQEARDGLFAPGSDWNMGMSYIRTNWSLYNAYIYAGLDGAWQQLNYFIYGMADTSGDYQTWLNIPVPERRPEVDVDGDGTVEDTLLIVSPDLRFPQGATIAEQAADEVGSSYYVYNGKTGWSRPDRGTWRWSYYWDWRPYYMWLGVLPTPYVSSREMRLIVAEAEYRQADDALTPEAAAIVDETRTAYGLDSSADGVNNSCVPRLPNGDCGDFLEMLKWEKKLETAFTGTVGSGAFFFDGRGWGDLYRGTFLQFPIPAQEAAQLGLDDPYGTEGGGQGMSSAGSIYGWPSEGS